MRSGVGATEQSIAGACWDILPCRSTAIVAFPPSLMEYKLRLHPNSEASFRYFSWFYGVYGGVSGTWRGRAVLVKLRYS